MHTDSTGFRIGYFNIDLKIRLNNLVLEIFNITYEQGHPYRKDLNRTHTCYNLHYFPQGNGVLKVGNDLINVSPDTFYFIPPDICHSKVSDERDPMYENHLQFDITVLDKKRPTPKEDLFSQQDLDCMIEYFSCKSLLAAKDPFAGETMELFRKIRFELDNLRIGYQAVLCSLFTELLVKLVRCFAKHPMSQYIAPLTCVDEIKRKHVIDNYFNWEYKTVTLEKAARDMSISKRHLERLVRKFYAMSFGEKLTEVRLIKAQSLLLNSDMTLEEICLEVGFKTSNYLHKLFKRHHNMTPGRFKKLNTTRNAHQTPRMHIDK